MWGEEGEEGKGQGTEGAGSGGEVGVSRGGGLGWFWDVRCEN